MRRPFALTAAVLTTACAPAPQRDEARDRAAVDSIRREFEAGENAGDVDRMSRHFATDVIGMPPSRATTVGPDALRETLRKFLAAYNVEVRYKSDEIVVAGDWAFDRGSANEILHPKAGGPAETSNGKYIWLYQRVNGEWKLARLIWNADPAPEAPPPAAQPR